MKKTIVFSFNLVVILITGALFFRHSATLSSNETIPLGTLQPGAMGPTKALAFVSYPEGASHSNQAKADIVTRVVNEQGQATITTTPQLIDSRAEPTRCSTKNLHPAPNGRYLIRQYNCESTLSAKLINLTQPGMPPHSLPPGYFLSWAPSGNWFLYRQTETDQIILIEAASSGRRIPLDLPDNTYEATFTPDGQQVTYAASDGLNLGSELGLVNLVDNNIVYRHEFPDQIVAFPRWSPTGDHLAYILVPDSNIPYTVGKLWLADTATGAPVNLLDDVDAGRGYPPAWAPDGQSVVYVHRENLDSVLANQRPDALHSNLYQVDVATGATTQLTHFTGKQVYDARWAPDGQTLAFTVDDAVWQVTPGQSPVQISEDGIARHPAWLVEPANDS